VFAGYLGVELARESSMRRAVETACVAAAKSVEAVGVQRAVPEREVVTAECERYDAR
jgi:sugar/nucleoside kinase (ribokinase family)